MADVSAEDIVQAAYQLQGAPYRPWRSGNSIPMFLDDGPFMDAFFQGGHEAGLAGLRSHLQDVGVMGVDLVHYALIANRMYEMGLDSGALYVGPHRVIQAIPGEGVTDAYTDQQTYSWASQGYPRYRFTIYGFLQGVRY